MKKFYITATGNDFKQIADINGKTQSIKINGEEIRYLPQEIFDDIQGGTTSLSIFSDNSILASPPLNIILKYLLKA